MSALLGTVGALLALVGFYLIQKSSRLRRNCTLPALARAAPPDDEEPQKNGDCPVVFTYTVGSKTLRGCAAAGITNADYGPDDEIKIMVNPENPLEFIMAQRRSIPKAGILILLLGAVLIALALLWR